MKKTSSKSPEFIAGSRAEWRAWLDKNHLISKNVNLVLYKKASPKFTFNVSEAIDEALCFGWIDSLPGKRDEESYCILFSKRNPKSKWSAVNKKKVADLTKKGLMRDEGKRMVALAKQTGTWSALDNVEKKIMPPDLSEAFAVNALALDHWNKFPPSVKRGILEWIENAKKSQTRANRIHQTVSLAAENIRANFPLQPKKSG